MQVLDRYRGALGEFLADEFFTNNSLLHKAFNRLLDYLETDVLAQANFVENVINPITCDPIYIPRVYKELNFSVEFRREFSSAIQERFFLYFLLQYRNANPNFDIVRELIILSGVASAMQVTEYTPTYYAYSDKVVADYTVVPNMTNTATSNYVNMARYNNVRAFYDISFSWLTTPKEKFARAIIDYFTFIKYRII